MAARGVGRSKRTTLRCTLLLGATLSILLTFLTLPALAAGPQDSERVMVMYRPGAAGQAEAAQAAQCAHEQGAFWDYHDLLFTGTLGHDRESYLQYADDLGLDAEALAECLDSERYAEEVQADAVYAINLGISGTPTFFINGLPMVGAQPLSIFVQVIEAELNQ